MAMKVPGPNDMLAHGVIATWMSLGGATFVMNEDKGYDVSVLYVGVVSTEPGDWIVKDGDHWRVSNDVNFNKQYVKANL